MRKTVIFLFLIFISSAFSAPSIKQTNESYPDKLYLNVYLTSNNELELSFYMMENYPKAGTYKNMTISLNEKYFYSVDGLLNKKIEIPLSEFANKKHERFSIDKLKPETIKIYASNAYTDAKCIYTGIFTNN